ncbi:unnamed protein product [Durusdinium trenchii]|uniref:C2 domain-containing protein n=1 Tax=Durusdinium trenchii TaxID=1381693 RepID=A0ABP0PE89_9DINO
MAHRAVAEPDSFGIWGNLEQLLGGTRNQYSRSDLEAEDRASPGGREDRPWGVTTWSSPKQSPMGSDSPVTLVEAGSVGSGSPPIQHRDRARVAAPSPLSKDGKEGKERSIDPEAALLHQILEQLYTALKNWEASVKSSTTLAGTFQPDRDYRQEEQAVNVASVAFEEFHAKLGQKSFLQRLGGGFSEEENRALTRGNQLLKALDGVSPWSDANKIEELLQLRAEYFVDSKWDPERLRFSCAELFLQLVSDKRKWPEAEVLALRWPANLDRMLGNNGRQAWIERAQQLPRTAPKKQSDGMCCGLPNLLEGTAENGPKAEKKAFTGCLTITKIKARNLRSADLLDDSDPFVKFELGSLTRPVLTSVVWNNEKNPEWKDPRTGQWETLRLPVTRASPDRFPLLQISVSDKDNFSSNDPLGGTSLPVLQLIEKQAGKGIIGLSKEVTFNTGPLQLTGEGAGDRDPYIEMEITWTPEGVGALAAPRDPLVLKPQEDTALKLLAEMEDALPSFLRDFGPASPDSLGFFLQAKDHRLDLTRAAPQSGNPNSEKVRQYNQVLNRINEQVYRFRRSSHEVKWSDVDQLLQKARDFERSVGQKDELRRIYAFQDEYLPDIGEWSTDRRRQLRNQVFLVRIEHGHVSHSGSAGAFDTFPKDIHLYIALLFLLAALAFIVLNFWALSRFHDEDGRGWILELSSLIGFLCVVAAFVVSFPTWKRYFEKPKSGVNHYQTVPPA